MTEKHIVQELLIKLEQHMGAHSFGDAPSELYDPIRYILSLGGKRIRPLLSLLAYGMYGKDPKEILNPSIAIEVFHNFTLLHDDIMDEAPLRRGKATVHEKWNANIAILSGDVMLVKAYDLLLSTPPSLLPEVVRLFNKTAAEVCEGQQLDMNFESLAAVREEDYLHMIRLKTAVLLGFSLQLGALLAGAKKEEVDHLYAFGVNIGIGFQLKDDLLDVYADQAKFGKQVGGDIISNKKTFLLIKALELAKGEELKILQQQLALKEFDKEKKVETVKAIYEKLGIQAIAEHKMQSYFEEAFMQLQGLEIKNEAYYQALLGITQELIHREK